MKRRSGNDGGFFGGVEWRGRLYIGGWEASSDNIILIIIVIWGEKRGGGFEVVEGGGK